MSAENAHFLSEDYLARMNLERVIEIHISGGGQSDPSWLPGNVVLRLDSHDSSVPEEVWRLLETTAPRCPNLMAITLERMEGTLLPGEEPLLAEELRRIRSIARGLG